MFRWNATMLDGAGVCCMHMTSVSHGTQAEVAKNITMQLRSVATRNDQFASLEELGAEIRVATPTASHALRLGDVFGDSLFTALDTVLGASRDHAGLQSAINAAGGSSTPIVGRCSVGHKPFWKCRPNFVGSITM